MIIRLSAAIATLLLFQSVVPNLLLAQDPPYDVVPEVRPPYFRVRYEASSKEGELVFPVRYTLWVPEGTDRLRGVVIHQHGCGEGSCKSGLTGAFDLHWQALARKHDCALLAPSYEQPADADCQMWCDPRNGSDTALENGLGDLARLSGHPELQTVPWALWGHSGGGHWAGGMVMLYPERVVAAWLRSGVPFLESDSERPSIKPHNVGPAVLKVPLMCNLGTREGVTDTGGKFAGVWPSNQAFFQRLRNEGALVGVAVDPLTAHECGNQRYLAIPWLDVCLTSRLPENSADAILPMPTERAWLSEPTGFRATSVADYAKVVGEDPRNAGWLPGEAIAIKWMQYVLDTQVADKTPPPSPLGLSVEGNVLNWNAIADLESGLGGFEVERDGKTLAAIPAVGANRFGRPLYQGLQYSDTPLQPLIPMRFVDDNVQTGSSHRYRIRAVNTSGLRSRWSQAAGP